jgi:hypothetical protein
MQERIISKTSQVYPLYLDIIKDLLFSKPASASASSAEVIHPKVVVVIERSQRFYLLFKLLDIGRLAGLVLLQLL